MGLKDVIETIIKYNKFLITSHVNMEGDSIGSQLALYILLEALGKESYIINETPVPKNLGFLPYIDKIKVLPKAKPEVDAVIVVDAAELSRIGKAVDYIPEDSIIINIDHHISNSRFGFINWIDDGASSTGEMIYSLYRKLKIPMRENSALCLYVAIATDTGSFRYSNTTAKIHRIVAEFLECGVKPAWVNERLNYGWVFKDMKILAYAISKINMTRDGRVAWISLTNRMASYVAEESPIMDSDVLIQFPRSLRDAKISILFRETQRQNKIKVSFRSKGKVDVNRLAKYFGGGGHKNASGCIVKGRLKEVEEIVIKKAKKYLKGYY